MAKGVKLSSSKDFPVAVVTGGASGIGRAVVADLTDHGYRVVSFDQDTTVSDGEVVSFVGDVRSPRDNERAVGLALDEFGRLDLFVGNAGIHDGGGTIADRSAEDLATLARRVFDVNVLGYLLGAHAAAEPLTRSGGAMVFTLSDASFVVTGNGAGVVYTSAKHAALGLVRHLAAELAPRVRVNAVAPGGVVTGLRAADGGEVFTEPEPIRERIREVNPLGVVLTPEELAPFYRFLAGPESVGMTGEVLRPDGGLSVR
ncbi:SDR family oxidoreductase [Lentzea sp. NPDC004782]|uniref:SDR family oxidoreductase n=1 Tax=Lentzea sp. NPDC004782 TaxID=3154458 RepID=UPI0033BE7F9D